MGDTREKLLPGTATTYVEHGEKGFSKIEMLLEATGGLNLSQVCAVTGLEGSTIQNWVKRGWVSHPNGKKYEEKHIARILIINALKECIKLEHIALLMNYVNGTAVDNNDYIIRESDLYNLLCDALGRMGKAQDQSRGGVEAVVEILIRGYKSPKPDSSARIRKALTLMIYACVCTDVKRRTEAMMKQILHDLDHQESTEPEVSEDAEAETAQVTPAETESAAESRKTVAQALREWDISSVEKVIIDHNEERGGTPPVEETEKTVNRPWYSRKSSK